MSQLYAFFLGSHADISASEVYSSLQAHQYNPQVISIKDGVFLASLDRELPEGFLKSLGGIDRIAKVVAQRKELWPADEIWQLLYPAPLPKQKITVGISTVGLSYREGKILGIDLKKAAKAAGQSLRFVLPVGQGSRLNAAQVLFNNLITPPHCEITVVKEKDEYLLTRTTHVQDIAAYEERDTQRPSRNAKVGMLPPKLAQIMINLAIAHLPQKNKYIVLDPFCGMGTILQESWLMGHESYGSDSSPAMVDASEENIDWITQHYKTNATKKPYVWQHDVRQPFPLDLRETVDAIITEPFLGKPLVKPLTKDEEGSHVASLAELYLSFFHNIRPLIQPGGVILCLLPAFRKGERRNDKFTLLPDRFLDAVKDQGYSLEQLIPAPLEPWLTSSPRGSLLYARPDALVGRELILWKKFS